MHQPKVILVIMDGWGYSPIKKGNAIYEANTPAFEFLWKNYAHLLLNAFGESVGLPWGNIGSSEVGHTSIGSGKLVFQELLKVELAVKNGTFNENEHINDFITTSKKNGRPIHLVGLVSNGGVHSHIDHLFAILDSLAREKVGSEVFIHMITDGRDTSPESALKFTQEVESKIRSLKNLNVKIASVSGRYYAMDRDTRWDRTKRYYLSITEGIGEKAPSAKAAIEQQYAKKITDEFIPPTNIDLNAPAKRGVFQKIFSKNETKSSTYDGLIHEHDNVFFFNIRPDRMRQILEMFLFPKNEIGTHTTDVNIITMITYNEFFKVDVAYPSDKIDNPLARILSESGVKQGHFAETEKYAHVTYFFNGGNSTPYKNEIWDMVHSPDVTTYDKKPEMSASQVTDRVFLLSDEKKLDFVLINYANCDMVGHTGVFDKVVNAVETVDAQIKRLVDAFPQSYIIVTADHGNAECMIHPETGEIDKKHTVSPVPFIIVNSRFRIKPVENENPQPSGILADITPTILELLDIKKKSEMNGISLLPSLARQSHLEDDAKGAKASIATK